MNSVPLSTSCDCKRNLIEEKNFESIEDWFIIQINEGKLQEKMFQVEKKKENMKYAIAQTSGKQFWVKPGQWYDVDLIKKGNLGDFISLKKVLFFRKKNEIQLGKPFLGKTEIPAKIVQQVKGRKIVVLKTKPKKKYTRTRGHRQAYTRVQIDILN